MSEVVGIKEENTNLISYIQTTNNYDIGDMLIIDNGKGEYIYKSVRDNEEYNPLSHKLIEGKISRVANSSELLQYLENQNTSEYEDVFKQMCIELDINVSLIAIDCSLEGEHLRYTYFSTEKLHFPKMIKYLLINNPKRKKIEFFQVGEREYYAINGGIGVCGYELCCHNRSYRTPTITTNSLTELGININLKKTLSGTCGKYKCCLLFEPHEKQVLAEKLPDIDQSITYLDQTVIVTQIDFKTREVTVLGEEIMIIKFDYFTKGTKC